MDVTKEKCTVLRLDPVAVLVSPFQLHFQKVLLVVLTFILMHITIGDCVKLFMASPKTYKGLAKCLDFQA